MDKYTLTQALCKLLAEESLEENELVQVKQMFCCSFFLPDMSDEMRQSICNATVDTINELFLDSVLETIGHALEIRYGIEE